MYKKNQAGGQPPPPQQQQQGGGYNNYPPQQGGYGYGAPPQQQNYGSPQGYQGGGYGYGNDQGYGSPQGGYGIAPQQQGGYGAPPNPQQGFPQQGGYGGHPPQQGGYGSPQGGYGAPPQQQVGYGAPQVGYGSPQQGFNQQGGYASPPQQQGGYGGPTPQQSGYGAPPQQQGGYGAPQNPQQQAPQGYGPPQQGAYPGAPQQGPFGGPPPRVYATINPLDITWERDRKEWNDFPGHAARRVAKFEYGPDTHHLVTCTTNGGDAQVFDIDIKTSLVQIKQFHNEYYDVDIAGDTFLFTGGTSGAEINICSISQKKILHEYLAKGEPRVYACTIIDGGAQAITMSDDSSRVVKIFDIKQARVVSKFESGCKGIPNVTSHVPGHPTCALISESSGQFTLLDARAKKSARTIYGLENHFKESFHFPWTTNGKFVGQDSDNVKIFDFGTGKVVHNLKTPPNSYTKVGYGCNILAVSKDGETRFWDLTQEGAELTPLGVEQHTVTGPTGTTIVREKTILVWDHPRMFSLTTGVK